MKNISFTTTVDEHGHHALLKEDFDASKFKPESIVNWQFSLADETTGSKIKAVGLVDELGVSVNEKGQYNPIALDLALNKGYCIYHVASYSKNDVEQSVAREDLMKLPDEVAEWVVAKADRFFDPKSVLVDTDDASKNG